LGLTTSSAGFKLSRVPRTLAHQLGVPVFDPRTRALVTPEAARAQALDKRAYDQNYECVFADENLTLLSHELINAAEADGVGEICERDWSSLTIQRLNAAVGPLYVGFDVARRGDLSVITVVERQGSLNLVRAILRIQDMRLPDQQIRLGEICRLPKFHRAAVDMTGLGLGLFEYAQKEFGAGRIHGINFATTVPATNAILAEGRKRETVRVTEALALELLQTYEDRRIRQPVDGRLRDDLRKPEKITTPGGRVSIAATRNEAGHADHFWSLALALEAAGKSSAPFAWQPVKPSYAGLGRKGVLM
jgi:phage FluMu gp28-like protein